MDLDNELECDASTATVLWVDEPKKQESDFRSLAYQIKLCKLVSGSWYGTRFSHLNKELEFQFLPDDQYDSDVNNYLQERSQEPVFNNYLNNVVSNNIEDILPYDIEMNHAMVYNMGWVGVAETDRIIYNTDRIKCKCSCYETRFSHLNKELEFEFLPDDQYDSDVNNYLQERSQEPIFNNYLNNVNLNMVSTNIEDILPDDIEMNHAMVCTFIFEIFVFFLMFEISRIFIIHLKFLIFSYYKIMQLYI